MELFQPIYDTLSSPVWASISVISTIILAIITGIQLRLKEKKEISYSIITDTPVIRVKEDVEKDIEIFFKGKAVRNVRLVELKIWNSGNVQIEKEHYEKPISFLPSAVEHKGKLLYLKIIDKDPEDLPVKNSLLYNKENMIGLPKILLHRRDSVTIKMLLADYDEEITVTGRIVGVPRIKEVITNNQSVSDHLKTGLIFFFVGFFIFVTTIAILDLLHMRDLKYIVFIVYLVLMIAFYFLSPLIAKLILKIEDKLFIKAE
jgi:hypothetical protein